MDSKPKKCERAVIRSFGRKYSSIERKSESGSELAVIKSILLREGYLERIKKLNSTHRDTITNSILNLLDIIRISSIDVVEAIDKWRKADANKRSQDVIPCPSSSYIWNGVNYLLKMPSDLDFLNKNLPLVRCLGFSMERNPFIIHLSMENQPKDEGETIPGMAFTQIGSVRKNIMARDDSVQSKSYLHKCISSNKHPQPYPAPVLGISTFGREDQLSRSGKGKKKHTTKLVNACKQKDAQIAWSYIEFHDLIRLRKAEQILLEEEQKYGRYLRDEKDKLIPSWKEAKIKFSNDLRIDDTRNIGFPAKSKLEYAPFALQSGFGHESNIDQPHTKVIDIETPPIKSKSKDRIKESRVQKVGGVLHSLPDPGTNIGRKRPPPGRSNQFTIGLGIYHRKMELVTLEDGVKELKFQLLRFDDPYLTNQNKDKDEASTSSSDCTIKSEIVSNIETKENQIETIKYEIRSKEQILSQLKMSEMEREDKLKAKHLERKRRMLGPGEILPEDEEYAMTIEDVCITSIQKHVRGRLTRIRYKVYRELFEESATIIQGGIRGMLGRRISFEYRMRYWGAIEIQRRYRGFASRMQFSHLISYKIRTNACTAIQRRFRSILARLKVSRMKEYASYGKSAEEAVSPENLSHHDLSNLAKSIKYRLTNDSNNLHPNVILFLLRIICIILGEGKQVDRVKSYNHLGEPYYEPLNANLSWETAVKMLMRGQKILRKLRKITMYTKSKNSKSLNLPQRAVDLYYIYKKDISFSKETFERMTLGSNVGYQLMVWLDSIMTLYHLQSRCLNDAKCCFILSDASITFYNKQRRLQANLLIIKAALRKLDDRVLRSDTMAGLKKSKDMEYLKIESHLKDTEKSIDWLDYRESNGIKHFIKSIKTKIYVAEEELKKVKALQKKYKQDLADDFFDDAGLLKETEIDVLNLDLQVQKYTAELNFVLRAYANEFNHRKLHFTGLDESTKKLCFSLGTIEVQIESLRCEKKQKSKITRGSKSAIQILEFTDDTFQEIDSSLKTVCRERNEYKNKINDVMDITDKETVTKYFSRSLEQENILPLIDSTEDIKNDEKEDETAALHEELIERGSISNFMKKQDTCQRPIIVLLNQTLLSIDRLVSKICADIGGNMVRIKISDNHGCNSRIFQDILDSGHIVIADINMGITLKSREAFLNMFKVTKDALINTPRCICVTNDILTDILDYDVFSPGLGRCSSLNSKDKALLSKMKVISNRLNDLKNPNILKQLKKFGKHESHSPEISTVLVMEAVVIILNPGNTFFPPPTKIIGISWGQTRNLLINSEILIGAILKVDITKIPGENLEILISYIDHEFWPCKQRNQLSCEGIAMLSDWIENVVDFACLLRSEGGKAGVIFEIGSHRQIFHEIITFSPKKGYNKCQNSHIHEKVYDQILSSILVGTEYFEGTLLHNSEEFNVKICHANNIFHYFVDFAKESRYIKGIQIRNTQLQKLLKFNKNELIESQDQFNRSLLNIVELRNQSIDCPDCLELVLVENRQLLLKQVKHICGHLTTVTIFGKVVGEIDLNVYLPQFGTSVKTEINSKILKLILKDADGESEMNQLQSPDSSVFMWPILHRLVIFPGITSIQDMGISFPDGAARYGKFKQKETGVALRLEVRKKGRAGRVVCKFCHKLNGVSFIIAVKEVGINCDFRVIAYNTSTAKVLETWIDAVEHQLFFPIKDRFSIRRVLKNRLNVQQKYTRQIIDKHHIEMTDATLTTKISENLYFDRTLLQTVKKIGKILFLVKATVDPRIPISFNFLIYKSICGTKYSMKPTLDYLSKLEPEFRCSSNMKITFDEAKILIKRTLGFISYDTTKNTVFFDCHKEPFYAKSMKNIQINSSLMSDSVSTKERKYKSLVLNESSNHTQRKQICQTIKSYICDPEVTVSFRKYNIAIEQKHDQKKLDLDGTYNRKDIAKDLLEDPENKHTTFVKNTTTNISKESNCNCCDENCVDESIDKTCDENDNQCKHVLSKLLRIGTINVFMKVFFIFSNDGDLASELSMKKKVINDGLPREIKFIGLNNSSNLRMILSIPGESVKDILAQKAKTFAMIDEDSQSANDLCNFLSIEYDDFRREKLVFMFPREKRNERIANNNGQIILSDSLCSKFTPFPTQKSLILRTVFTLPIIGAPRPFYESVVSIYKLTSVENEDENNKNGSLGTTIYVPCLLKTCYLQISVGEQKHLFQQCFNVLEKSNSRTISKSEQSHKSESLKMALLRLARYIHLELLHSKSEKLESSNLSQSKQIQLIARFHTTPYSRWHGAYLRLNERKVSVNHHVK